MKVLLLSHNPITTYQSMGKTFLSLFSQFSKEELCQLYIYPSLPDVDICSSYFRITDRNVLTSYWHLGKVDSKEISSSQVDKTKHDFYENEKEESFIRVKKTPLKTLCRDLMWKYAHWYNAALKKWLTKEAPTCIFLAPGEAKFIYDMATRISNDYHLPIITYVCDEFYFVNKVEGAIDRYRLHLLQKKMRSLMKKTSCIVAISDEIKQQYSSKFGVPTETIMTGANIPLAEKEKAAATFSGITYLGNLAYDRLSSLLEIGTVLDEINAEKNRNIKLYLYTRSLNDDSQRRIEKIKSIEYKGYVSGEAFTQVFLNADALLHIESFQDLYVERVKNSISTKIADSLASGIPMIAYAPEHIASMRYLASEGSAMIITCKESLKEKIEAFIDNESLRAEISKKGLASAKENHVATSNSERLKTICENVSVRNI